MSDFQGPSRAHDTVCPLIVSMWCGNGRIIDKDGKILARGSEARDWRGVVPDQILYAEVDPLSKRRFSTPDFKAQIKSERQAAAYAPVCRPAATPPRTGGKKNA